MSEETKEPEFLFDWDAGNTKHVIYDYPDRSNTEAEVESLFADPYFRPSPDRISKYGEQEFSGVAVGTEGIKNMLCLCLEMARFALSLAVEQPANNE